MFCAIIRGELAAARITETDNLLAFLDHRPLFHGHTLLVPKEHMRLLSDLPAALAAEFPPRPSDLSGRWKTASARQEA